MSVLQSKESEIRYMKRKNLEQESKIVGNYYRDLIRSYGVDVTYQKLDTSIFENYKMIIDQNLILQQAYGYNITPDYSCSARMISYVETEADIFLLNKYGLNPNTDINFYFDSTDFACALASQCGQYQEYKIKETTIECFVPDCTDEIKISKHPETQEFVTSSYVSSEIFPYNLGLGYNEYYECELLSGRLSVEIYGYEYDKEYTVVCQPIEHSDFKIDFPSNKHIYKSLKHQIKNTEYLETLIFLTYKVQKLKIGVDIYGNEIYKNLLTGRIHGGVLFYNLNKIGKYLEKIHPEVGDIIILDFPDETNPEKYEITDCYDKSLQTDGISPLLHKYIWKCKARRYVNNYDVVEENDADRRLYEKQELVNLVDEHIAKEISIYNNDEDDVYGGYNKNITTYDSQVPGQPYMISNYEYIEDGTAMDILCFGCGSKLTTNGYDLFFINAKKEAYKLTTMDHIPIVKDSVFEQNLRFLKATKDSVVFIDIEGTTYKLVENIQATQEEMQICLNSMFDVTLDPGNIANVSGNSFYTFKGCKTLLWSTPDHLYCKLESDTVLYKLI